jgi:hypothetical protein
MSENLILTRRRAMLDLLERACRSHLGCRLCVNRDDAAPFANVEFVAFDDSGVWIAAPPTPLSGKRGLWVRFEHRGATYLFQARAGESLVRAFDHVEPTAVVPLSLPLRLERIERRDGRRIHLPAERHLMGRLTHATVKHQQFDLIITDLSLGGLGGLLEPAAVHELDAEGVFWAELELPGDDPLEFVVRLAHCENTTADAGVPTGWVFCPGDDETTYHRNLSRVERFVAAHGRDA